MSKASTTALTACACALVSMTAMAQIKDPTIPAGAGVLMGTPSGGVPVKGLPGRGVPPVSITSPVTGASRSCGAGPACGPPIIRHPRLHHFHGHGHHR